MATSLNAKPPSPPGFLSPYRVLDLTDHRGLLAGQMLARLGAEVIQVEPPAGSPARRLGPFDEQAGDGEASLYWAAYAAGKLGVACDLDDARGQDLLRRLALTADFLVESETPGAMARRGLDFASLHAVNPALVHVSITPFGSTGPKAHDADSEITLWASAGPLAQTRVPGRPPLRISVPQAYLHGAADAAGGALVAHFARLRTGLGQHVDISAQRSAMQSTLSSVLAPAVGHAHFAIGGAAPPAGAKKTLDLSGSGARTRRSKWTVADGLVEMHLAMGPAAGRFTNALFAWIREEVACDAELAAWDWVTVPGRIASGELDDERMERARDVVAAFLATRTKRELMEAAIRRRLLLAPVATMADQLASPHLRERGFLETMPGPSGRDITLPGAYAVADVPGFVPLRPAPRLGEHTSPVLERLLGLGKDDLATLRLEGVIR